MLKITITTELIDWLQNDLSIEADEAEEFAEIFVGILQMSGGISPSTLPCDACELEGGCLSQPFTEECKDYRSTHLT